MNTLQEYDEFINSKTRRALSHGFEPLEIIAPLFDWQEHVVKWAVRQGRAALFEDCGLGKTAHHGLVIDKILMPTRPSDRSRECDAVAVCEWIEKFQYTDDIAVALETPSKHSPGTLALCSMWDCYGAIRGILESCGIKHVRIAPRTWQAEMLGIVPKGETKAYARAKAREIWPDEDWLATPRSKTANMGFIDAALIAEFYRRKLL
jgi:hypothetical protein